MSTGLFKLVNGEPVELTDDEAQELQAEREAVEADKAATDKGGE